MTAPELRWHHHQPVVLLPDFSSWLEISWHLLLRTHWDKLDYPSDRHAYEANDNAGEPLPEWQRSGVREITKELYYDDLEYDRAAEHRDEHVVV